MEMLKTNKTHAPSTAGTVGPLTHGHCRAGDAPCLKGQAETSPSPSPRFQVLPGMLVLPRPCLNHQHMDSELLFWPAFFEEQLRRAEGS